MRRRRSGLNFGRQRRKFNLPLFREVVMWIAEIALVIVLAYVCVTSFGFSTNVVGQAMETQLSNGDQLLINRFAYAISRPKSGDVVVFLPNGNEKSHYYVRRVIAGPGDTVQIKNGAVYVNGERYIEETDVVAIEDAGMAEDELTMGEDEYFVLGDNRNSSEDSRYANIGMVRKEYIIGKAWFRFVSLGNMGFVR